jgi:hypothetical protein
MHTASSCQPSALLPRQLPHSGCTSHLCPLEGRKALLAARRCQMELVCRWPGLGRGALPCCLQLWHLISSCPPHILPRSRLVQSSSWEWARLCLPALSSISRGQGRQRPGHWVNTGWLGWLDSLFTQLCRAFTSRDPQ